MIESQIKKIFSDTLIYGVGNILNRFLAFLLLPVYTHYFTPDEFGVFSLVYAFWFFAAVIYLFGMETSFQKYFIESKEFDEKKLIFSSSMILMLLTSVFFSLIIYFSSGFIAGLLTGDENNRYLIELLSLLLIIDTLSRFPMILINSNQLSKIYTAINVFSVIVNIICNIVFIIILKYSIESIFYSFLISYSFLLFTSIIICRKYISIKFDFDKVKSLIKFSHNFVYYGIFLISLDLIDRFILGYYRGNDEVGVYSACYRIGMIMNLIISGFRTAWFPFFLNLKDNVDNKNIFSKIFSLFCYTSMLVFLIISLFLNDIIKIKFGDFFLIDPRYWNGIIILPFILLSYFLFGLYTNLNVASYFVNKVKYLIISSGAGCLSNILFNFILVPPFSYIGAAVATFLSYLLMFLILYFYSQKLFHISYEWKRIFIVISLTMLLFVINNFIIDYQRIIYLNELIKYLLKVFSVIILLITLLKFGVLNFGKHLVNTYKV